MEAESIKIGKESTKIRNQTNRIRISIIPSIESRIRMTKVVPTMKKMNIRSISNSSIMIKAIKISIINNHTSPTINSLNRMLISMKSIKTIRRKTSNKNTNSPIKNKIISLNGDLKSMMNSL